MNNRPIKFRVWSTEYKQWMNHCSVIDSEGNILILYYELKQDGMLHPIVSEYSPDSIIIQQLTGLTDSTGKEIYEGDIIEDDSHGIGAVCFGKFSDNEFIQHQGFYVDWKSWPEFNNGFSENRQSEFKAVGNIFETPELLK